VADGLLPGRLPVGRLERQRHLDQLLQYDHAPDVTMRSTHCTARRRLGEPSLARSISRWSAAKTRMVEGYSGPTALPLPSRGTIGNFGHTATLGRSFTSCGSVNGRRTSSRFIPVSMNSLTSWTSEASCAVVPSLPGKSTSVSSRPRPSSARTSPAWVLSNTWRPPVRCIPLRIVGNCRTTEACSESSGSSSSKGPADLPLSSSDHSSPISRSVPSEKSRSSWRAPRVRQCWYRARRCGLPSVSRTNSSWSSWGTARRSASLSFRSRLRLVLSGVRATRRRKSPP